MNINYKQLYHIMRNGTKKIHILSILNISKYGRLTCELCKEPIKPKFKNNDISLDHIIPKSLGGDKSLENLRITHSSCNSVRGNERNLIKEAERSIKES